MENETRPIIAYHAVFTAYGFWLPNDERGSYSTEVWAPRLQRFGATVDPGTTRSVAKRPFDRARRDEARSELKYPAVKFNAAQRTVISLAIGQVITEYELPTYAAAFLPDHAHLVFGRHRLDAEAWVGYFKRAASRELRKANLHPFEQYVNRADNRVPTPWVDGGWKVYLHSDDEILRTIRYINANPLKAGLPAQQLDYISPFTPSVRRHG
jgi:REP element-mobilizing transposase RayT